MVEDIWAELGVVLVGEASTTQEPSGEVLQVETQKQQAASRGERQVVALDISTLTVKC